jgi:hypothetical protein
LNKKQIFRLFSNLFLIPVGITFCLIQKELIIDYTGEKTIATVDSTYVVKAEATQYCFYYSFKVEEKTFFF